MVYRVPKREPFSVGFNFGGFELGLDPNGAEQAKGEGSSTPSRGVQSLDAR